MEAEDGVRIAGADHLSSRQVARRLGVKVETVYAYASRGVLHPRRLPGRRESYFALAEVAALTTGSTGTRRRPPGLSEDVRTALTLIEDDQLSYRGHDAVALARDARFEDVVELLWQHPARFEARPEDVAAARQLLTALPRTASPVDRLRLVTSLVAATTPARHDLAPGAVTTAVGRLVTTSAMTVPALPAARPGAEPRHDRPRAGGGQPDPASADRAALDPTDGIPAVLADQLGVEATAWVEQACILLIDHDLAGSTTAARVAASARADPFAVLTAAAAAFDSPLHGTAGRRAHRLVAALDEDPADTLAHTLEQDRVAGFGHVVYAEEDPRAELLIASLSELVDHPVLASVELLSDQLWQRRGWPRNVDLALGLGAYLLGGGPLLPETLFLHARMIGWTAHLLEEYTEPPLRFRLQGVYTGPRP